MKWELRSLKVIFISKTAVFCTSIGIESDLLIANAILRPVEGGHALYDISQAENRIVILIFRGLTL